MLFLSEHESRDWRALAGRVLDSGGAVIPVDGLVRPGLAPAFHYYAGTMLLAKNMNAAGREWINAGVAGEQGGLFSNAYLASYLNRNDGRLVIPETIFADPAPYVHFAGTPLIRDSRVSFRTHCTDALPAYTKPLRIMDIGCGHGMVLADLLLDLRKAGRIGDVGEILLIDPSEGMLKLAMQNLAPCSPKPASKSCRPG